MMMLTGNLGTWAIVSAPVELVCLLGVEDALVSVSSILEFALSLWARFVLLLDLVRRFLHPVTFDQPPLVHQKHPVVVPIVLTTRCCFFTARSVQPPESTLPHRHQGEQSVCSAFGNGPM